MGVSGGAFCAVTTLPPPEQAAAESRAQLAGHQASQGSLSPVRQPGALHTRQDSSSPLPWMSATLQKTAVMLLYLLVSNPIMMRLRLLSVTKPALRSGSPQDGVRACTSSQSTAPPAGCRGDCRGSHSAWDQDLQHSQGMLSAGQRQHCSVIFFVSFIYQHEGVNAVAHTTINAVLVGKCCL